MTMVAYDHSKYQIEVANAMTHTGPASPAPSRAGLYDRWKIYNDGFQPGVSENIISANSNYWSTEILVCLALIIDDGVPSRGHRTNFFNPNSKFVGIGIYPHDTNRDRLTFFYGVNKGTCPGCANFTDAQLEESCLYGFNNSIDSCDPAQIRLALKEAEEAKGSNSDIFLIRSALITLILAFFMLN